MKINRNSEQGACSKNEKPNDLIDSKFKTLKSLSELPLAQKELWNEYHTKITDILANDLGKGSDYDQLTRFIAFQQMQIQGIQKEMQNSLNTILKMAKEIDQHFEKVKAMIPNPWN